jgi:outer membrane protein OmpA-like peptidoglycan-associated protein
MELLMKPAVLVICFAIFTSSFGLPALAQDKKDARGSKDHPLISRFPDTFIQSYFHSDFDEFFIATGPITPEILTAQGKTALPPKKSFEGEKTVITYQANNNDISALAVYKNFEKAFMENGFEKVFACKSATQCGDKFVRQMYWYGDPTRQGQNKNLSAPNILSPRYAYYYWSGIAKVEGGNYVIALLVAQRGGGSKPVKLVLDVNKVDTLDLGKVTVDLKGMSNDINKKGKVVLDGIYFDTDKATLTQDSLSTIAIIADYLKQNNSQEFFVVGHTDSQGSLAHNNKLSKARAQAVIDALVSKHAVNSNRLSSFGIGPISPATSNHTKEGRAKNRRVELVLKN